LDRYTTVAFDRELLTLHWQTGSTTLRRQREDG
jgi:hypothetical protein